MFDAIIGQKIFQRFEHERTKSSAIRIGALEELTFKDLAQQLSGQTAAPASRPLRAQRAQMAGGPFRAERVARLAERSSRPPVNLT